MDPLSDVLSLLKPRSYRSGGFDAGGKWAIQFPQHEGIKCYAVVQGECQLSVEGVPEPVTLQRGDCFLLPGGRPFCLSNAPGLKPVDAHTIFPVIRNGSILRYQGGGDFFSVGSYFALTGKHTSILLKNLPPVVHIKQESDKLELRWAVERMMQELREERPGSVLVAQHLAHMILVQALRLHLAEGAGGSANWLFALADPYMSAAINAMHAQPAHPWTVQALATHVGMSRSTFAMKFKALVGKSPMEYMTDWRMLLAGDRLMNASDSVSVIAQSLGYESESAFSTAFKRVMGCSPRQYGSTRMTSTPEASVLPDGP